MDRRILVPGIALVVTLSACDTEPQGDERVVSVDLDTPIPDESTRQPPPPPPYYPVDAENDGLPDLTPAELTPEAERSETGARNVLRSWARAIELKEFDQAYALLGETDRGRWSRSEWAGLFRGLSDITVAVPNGRIEGAAGSSYYSSEATITATDADGRPIRIEGPIVLRRVNDVPGSSAEQRRWHIESADLTWTH